MESRDNADCEVRRVLIAVSLVWALGLMALTAHRLPVWRSDVALWQATVDTDPGLLRPRVNVAMALMDAGEREASASHWDAAGAIHAGDHGLVHPRFMALQIALTRASLGSAALLPSMGCVEEAHAWTCPDQ